MFQYKMFPYISCTRGYMTHLIERIIMKKIVLLLVKKNNFPAVAAGSGAQYTVTPVQVYLTHSFLFVVGGITSQLLYKIHNTGGVHTPAPREVVFACMFDSYTWMPKLRVPGSGINVSGCFLRNRFIDSKCRVRSKSSSINQSR